MESKKAVVTQTMPAIALRGLVLFPKMVLHFDIGREKSILALNNALENGRKIFLVAQHDVADDDPTPDRLYKVGVVAEIKQVIKITDKGLRVMAEGMYRAKIAKVRETAPYFVMDIRPFNTKRIAADSDEMVSALMRTVKNLFRE